MQPNLETLAQDAAWLPYAYDLQQDTLAFAHVPRDTHRRVTFLDPRYLGDAPKSQPLPLPALPAARAQPLHFIFHTAFCCSTLLARALDLPGVSMSLKEPALLVPLGYAAAVGKRTETHARALQTILDLLSRPLSPRETQVVKLSNAANLLLPEILATRPESKVLLLYSDLDVFLKGTVNKGPPGRSFARHMFTQLYPHAPLAKFKIEEMIAQTDLQLAAQAWLMQLVIFDRMAKHFGPTRVRTLKDETFLAKKADALSRVGALFKLAQPKAGWTAVASSPVFNQHAKHPDDAFNDAARRAGLERTHASHQAEIDAALAWAREIATHTGAPQSLGDTLFDA